MQLCLKLGHGWRGKWKKGAECNTLTLFTFAVSHVLYRNSVFSMIFVFSAMPLCCYADPNFKLNYTYSPTGIISSCARFVSSSPYNLPILLTFLASSSSHQRLDHLIALFLCLLLRNWHRWSMHIISERCPEHRRNGSANAGLEHTLLALKSPGKCHLEVSGEVSVST